MTDHLNHCDILFVSALNYQIHWSRWIPPVNSPGSG